MSGAWYSVAHAGALHRDFLIGPHDVNAPTGLTEEYNDLLDAPHKEIVWFEHSGHTP
jgi:hypothetical protein